MTTRNLLACAISAAIATAACAADNGETLETIFIKTQRGYSADATETNRDYSAFAATVGTKIPATPREIPQSISIITSQQIKDRNVETLDQLARKTPGLRVLSNDDGRSSIYARGYEYDEYNVNGLPARLRYRCPRCFLFWAARLHQRPTQGAFDVGLPSLQHRRIESFL